MPRPVPTPCVCTTVKRVSRALARSYDRVLAPVGLNVTQLAVMRAVRRRSGEPLVRVADELSMDRTTLYRSLSPLRREGWITIEEASGSRSRAAATTAKGDAVLAEAGPMWEAMQIAIIDRFGRSAWRDLVDDLERLQGCLQDDGIQPVRR